MLFATFVPIMPREGVDMRKSAVAGRFYQGTAAGLRSQIEACFMHPMGPGRLPHTPGTAAKRTLGLVSPHAGYAYSGPVAAHGFLHISSEPAPPVVIIIGPNHYGVGPMVAVSEEDRWQTPLGDVIVDVATGAEIVANSHRAAFDDQAHVWEHSVEVQLPFLQYVYGDGFRAVLISMLEQDLTTSQDLGNAIAATLRNRDGLVIASTDFTHQEPVSVANKKDKMVLDTILALEPDRTEEVVLARKVSMCGPGPVMAMIFACKELGAGHARLLHYGTSGDITGDPDVVGYASVAIMSGQPSR